MKKAKSSLKVKLAISIGSLVFFIILLEIVLRIIGFSLSGGEHLPAIVDISMFPTAKILCVGDSFTHGGMVFREGKTYPDILQNKLNRIPSKKKYTVINMGVCESNTSELRRNLPMWVDAYKPETIILLSGSTNRFNPWDKNRDNSAGANLTNKFFDLKVVKMARITLLNLKARDLEKRIQLNSGRVRYYISDKNRSIRSYDFEVFARKEQKRFSKTDDGNPSNMLWHYIGNQDYEAGIEYGLKLLDSDNKTNPEIILALFYLYLKSASFEKSEELISKAAVNFPQTEMILSAKAYSYRYIADFYRMNSQYERAIEYYLKAIRTEPSLYYNYYMMTKVYDLQSYYDSETIFGDLKNMMKVDPELSTNEVFNSYLNVYRDKKSWEDGIEEWMNNDLEWIVSFCRNRGIKLVIQNYPVPYPLANRVSKRIADENNLLFVDNTSVFSKLLPREDFLYDDDHCTAKGHEIMVDNILKVLFPEKVNAQ